MNPERPLDGSEGPSEPTGPIIRSFIDGRAIQIPEHHKVTQLVILLGPTRNGGTFKCLLILKPPPTVL